MERKIKSIRWREEGTSSAFADFGDAFKRGTFRKYLSPDKTVGSTYEAEVYITGGALLSKLRKLREAIPERFVQLHLYVEGMDDPIVMESRATTTTVSTTPTEYLCEFADYQHD